MDVKDAFLICVLYFYCQRGGNGVNYLADMQQQVAFDAFTNNCLVLLSHIGFLFQLQTIQV